MKSISFSVERVAFLPSEKSITASDLAFVPAMLRRRLSTLEKLALAAMWQVYPHDNTCVPVVFASRFGELQRTEKLMHQFLAEGEVSPAGFSLSVHNAAPAVFSLATKNEAPYTALSGGERTLETALLDALAGTLPAVFVYAEEPFPQFFENEPEAATTPFTALALLLTRGEKFSLSPCFNEAAEPISAEAIADFFSKNETKKIVAKNFSIERKS